MSDSHACDYATLGQALALLAKAGIIPRVAAALDASMPQVGDALRGAVLAEIPAFAASGNPDILPELGQHTSQHAGEIHRLMGGGAIGDFDFVRVHARHRAEQRFPLETMLHAYRCGHRVLARWVRDAAIAAAPRNLETAVPAISDFAIEYTNAISSIATAEYVAHTRALAESEGDRRKELLNILLTGFDESDGRVARLLRRAGYLEQRRSYCLAVAQSANAAEMENPARAQRIATAIADALASTSIRVLAGIRNNLVIAVMSDRRRQSGWTAAQAGVAERIYPRMQLLGPAVVIGVSADHPSTSFIPKALNEATIALDFANVTNRVVHFSALPIRGLLMHRGAEYVRSALPSWAQALAEADTKADGALVQTLRAVAAADMNVQQAARVLGRHPNTVTTRIARIRDITGLDGQRYHDLTELLLAADFWRM